jgi:hypothetical protein
LPDLRFDQHDARALPVVQLGDRVDALLTDADTPRRLGHLRLGDQVADRRIPPREVDAGELADQAATAVAPDQVLRPQRPAVGQRDLDTAVVLREAGHRSAAMDRHRELGDPRAQDLLDALLEQRQPVVVAGWKVADVEGDQREARDLHHLALREEAIGDATLIEHLDRACMQTACARVGQVVTRAPLDDGDVDLRQRELGRQHHSRRPSSSDQDGVVRHGQGL